MITVPGKVTSALPHLAAAGMALIADASRIPRVRYHWTDEVNSSLVLDAPVSNNELAEAVLAHVRHHAEASSWLAATTEDGHGLFSPRLALPSDWDAFSQRRLAAYPEVNSAWDFLDDRLIGALGEPAWWRAGDGSSADSGASRWEMKTRNRGEDFISRRLWPLAQAVSTWTADDVEAGLTGRGLRDDQGKGKADSRSATGLTPPGPADNALVWCALWGLATTRTIHSATTISASSAMWPTGITHPRWAAMPVYTSPVGVERWSAIVNSRQFASYASTLTAVGEIDAVRQQADERWLLAQGVRAVVLFSIMKTDNVSSPERWVQPGEIHGLASVE